MEERIDGERALLDWLDALERGGQRTNVLTVKIGTDEGIRALARSSQVSQLDSLTIHDRGVTDAGITALADSPNLTGLRNLTVMSVPMTDAGVTALVQSRLMSRLTHFCLAEVGLSSAGTVALAGNVNADQLRSLQLGEGAVSDDGLMALANNAHLAQLESLIVGGRKVTDAGLEALAGGVHTGRLKQLVLLDTCARLPIQLELSRDAQAVYRYFRESRKGEPLLEVKVPVLGLGRLGKTLLVRHLAGDAGAFERDNPATHGFEVRPVPLTVPYAEKDHQCWVRLFDFGGQPELHGTHRFFLADQRNVYVIVVSARLTQDENRLDYWLRMVYHHGGAPVVVVVSHCDDESGAGRGHQLCDRVLPQLNATELSEAHKLFVQVVDNYSNVTGDNIDQVKAALQRAIARLDAVFTVPFAPGFVELRDFLTGQPVPSLQRHPAFDRYWSITDDFRPACKTIGQADPAQQHIWLVLLRDLGYVHYVGDRDRVRVKQRHGYVLPDLLFHPEWVKKPVYDVVGMKAERLPGGIVSERQIDTTLRRSEITDQDVPRLMSLMLECDLLFRVQGGDPGSPDYLIPDHVDVRPRDTHFDWTDNLKSKLRWDFQFLPDYLLAQLVGRWFNHQPAGFTYYRDDVILTRRTLDCRVRLRADFNTHALYLEFDQGRNVDELRVLLVKELEDLLHPDGEPPKPLWEEVDLQKPPSPIDDNQVQQIAEVLVLLVTGQKQTATVENIATTVKSVFESSQKLPPAVRLSFRICMLFAYAKAVLVVVDIVLPKARIINMKEVLDWLNGTGAAIKVCFKGDPKFETCDNPGSFCASYRSALNKLGLREAAARRRNRRTRKPGAQQAKGD